MLRGSAWSLRYAVRPPGGKGSPAASLPEELRRSRIGDFAVDASPVKLRRGTDSWAHGETIGEEV